MSAILSQVEPLTLHFKPVLKHMNDQDFFEFCQANPELQIERTSEGDLIIMPPTGGNTGRRNFILSGKFNDWVEADGTGIGLDSSTGFTLPSGAMRAPDLSWVRRDRWQALSEAERDAFPPLCPDFVVELRSPSDSLSTLQDKMQEYIDNGAQLGWLIDPFEKTVYIYRPNRDVLILNNPETISGEPLLSGFTLNLQQFWT